MTPKKAIKKRCSDCRPIKSEFPENFCDNCHLKNNDKTYLKRIRDYCFSFCMNGQRNEVVLCMDNECPLYQFRLGKNPNLKGNPDIKNYSKFIKK